MRIYNFSRIIAIPFAIVFGIVLYKSLTDIYFDYSILMVPFGLVLAILYVLSPQIDFWWQKKYPVKLETEIIELLDKHNPFYRDLSISSKEKFNQRLSLFMNGKEFFAMGREKQGVPYDLKALIAQIPIHISLAGEDFMFGNFDRIVLYKHPFPSPRFSFLHAMETHVEDGVIILSLEHLEAAIRQPDKFYHVGYHVFVEAFIKLNPSILWPDIDHLSWENLEKISNFPSAALFKSVGFKSLDLLIVLLCYYFVFPKRFMEQHPKLKQQIDQIFYKA